MFKDGNKRNFKIKNLVCVSRSMLARLYQDGYSYYPQEIKPTVFELAWVKAKLSELKKRG